MIERRKNELALIEAEFGEIEIGVNLDWVIIKHWLLPEGWNKSETQVLVLIPPGYSVTPPDNFYTDNDLRLTDSRMPGNASANQPHLGRQWIQFSFHVEGGDWKPSAELLEGHNLMTFLEGVRGRLAEVS
jgi:hypothetical protein